MPWARRTWPRRRGGGIVTPPLQNRSWAQRVDANTQNIAAPAQSAAPPAAAPQQAARAATQDYQRAIFLLRVVPQETAR